MMMFCLIRECVIKQEFNMKIIMFILVLLLMILLTCYAPIELSRIFILDNFVCHAYPEILLWEFVFELIFIWLNYSIGIGIIAYLITSWIKTELMR